MAAYRELSVRAGIHQAIHQSRAVVHLFASLIVNPKLFTKASPKGERGWESFGACSTFHKLPPGARQSLRPPVLSAARSAANGSSKSYQTLAKRVDAETEVKRSKFLAMAAPVADEAAALAFLEEVGDTAASHNCWAFKVGQKYRFSDDGEPGGTAGCPIFAAIEAANLDYLVVVVVRYFGGTKLGAGGLVRAYRGAAAACLQDCPVVEVKAKLCTEIVVPYHLLGVFYQQLDAHGAVKLREEHGANSNSATIQLSVDEEQSEQLEQALISSSGGRIHCSGWSEMSSP